jgi:hypothetical protein
LTEKDPSKRVWYLLACSIRATVNKGTGDAHASRIARLDKYLDETEKMAEAVKNDPDHGAERREVRNRCRDVTELYDDDVDPAVQAAVERANKIAKMVAK